MLTFDDEGGRAGAVAGRLHGLLEELGVYVPEKRPWLPHVTVLRFREAPGLSRLCRTWEQLFRPMRLFTSHGCVPAGRSTKFWNRSS